jgi:hypothetical protein
MQRIQTGGFRGCWVQSIRRGRDWDVEYKSEDLTPKLPFTPTMDKRFGKRQETRTRQGGKETEPCRIQKVA